MSLLAAGEGKLGLVGAVDRTTSFTKAPVQATAGILHDNMLLSITAIVGHHTIAVILRELQPLGACRGMPTKDRQA